MTVLSKRLNMVAALVTTGNTVADVGCDHAHTSIYLAEKGISPGCIAMDVRKGPLEMAETNVRKSDVADRIQIRLSDGLTALRPGEVDTVLISGMGGLLILEILEKYPEKTASVKELVLSPQSDMDKVREWLSDHGFVVTDEEMCFDAGKYYLAIKAENAKLLGIRTSESTGEKEHFRFSGILNKKRHEVYIAYLKHELSECEKIIERLRLDEGEKARLRLEELYDECRRLNNEIDSMR
ncbi:MAG: class I SAM-dependent methyltransferase [Lachnospiraceae bacterium]|nr:class I SAM-dependent methyltransferase [Lachnospiraceae bacterium]